MADTDPGMMNIPDTGSEIRENIIKLLLLCIAIPILGIVLCNVAFPSLSWMEVPFHSLLESIGLFAGFFVGILLLLQLKERENVSYYIWIISALFGMAILDGFHASVSSGNLFIWLHSIAVCIGGILFAGVWVSAACIPKHKICHATPLGIAAISIIIGSISLIFPAMLPIMATGATFTPFAQVLNIIGGVFFLFAAFWFLTHYRIHQSEEDFYFAGFCLLNGVASISFILSYAWDAGWWLWHIMRVGAYIILLLYILDFFTKVSEAASASHYTRSLIEASIDPLMMISPDGKITDVNKASLIATGKSRETLIGSDFSRYFTEPEKAAAVYREVLSEGSVRDFPLTLKHFSCTTIEVRFNASIFQNKKGMPQGVFAAARDVTELTIAEDALKAKNRDLEDAYEELTATEEELRQNYIELAKSQKELKEAQEQLVRKEKLAVLGKLSGGIGHELRNPLGAIKNSIYLLNLVLENPEPDVKEAIDIINTEVVRSEDIISSLLDFAWPKLPVRRLVQVNTVLKESLSRHIVPERIIIVNNSDQNVPEIMADPDKLIQVLGNLITNAIQAMPDGGILTVTTNNTGSDTVAITITDTGTGITEENMSKMFEPLFTTKTKGIGLGLVISKMIVEAHGGHIDMKSAPGKGTAFTIHLPIGIRGDQ